MSKKKPTKFSAHHFGTETPQPADSTFYFNRDNYKLMLAGLALIILGFLLMLGPDANTVDGKFDPNAWNEGIFSVLRIRIAPFLVMAGFAVEAYAILKRNK